jgi:hypothetical protein
MTWGWFGVELPQPGYHAVQRHGSVVGDRSVAFQNDDRVL